MAIVRGTVGFEPVRSVQGVRENREPNGAAEIPVSIAVNAFPCCNGLKAWSAERTVCVESGNSEQREKRKAQKRHAHPGCAT